MSGHTLQFRELLRLSLRTFRTKPARAILTILGMSVGIGTVLFLISLGYGLQYILIGKLITTEDSLITMEISYPTESNLVIKKETLDRLHGYQDVSEVSPVASFPGEVSVSENSGLLADTLIVEPSYFRLAGISPEIGAIPKAEDNGVILSKQTIIPIGLVADQTALTKKLGLKVFYQDDATGISQEVISSIPMSISGLIMDDTLQPQVIVFANSLSADPPFYRKALVKARNIDVVEILRDKLINEGFLVSARIDLVNQARKITNVITIVLGVFGITALIVSAIGMFNTMIVGFMERTYEVGILKSIGATDGDVRNLFLVESTMMGLLGGVGGIAIGMVAGNGLNLLLNVWAKSLGGKGFQLFLTPWWFIVLILVLSLFIGLISGLWPAYRASKLSPKEAFTRR
ncbi:MAG: FtsX-like permease family protein [Candidatus Paceibacterota bacterium]